MEKKDVYSMVTEKIIAEMEKGIIPWHKPWHGVAGGAISYATGKPYSLINQFLLGKEGEWLTFKQIQDLGGKVKKGAKSEFCVFFKMCPSAPVAVKDPETGEIEMVSKLFPVLRYYNVFHISDCEGIESKVKERKNVTLQPVDEAEKIINNYFSRETCKLTRDKASNKAFFRPSTDEVVVPMMEQYDSISEYYSTLFHEVTHSTGVEKRLNRDMSGFFGSEPYSKEELVAEIGSAMLCTTCGLDSKKTFKNSVAYLQSWIKALKDDKKLIVSASCKAEKAVEFILG